MASPFVDGKWGRRKRRKGNQRVEKESEKEEDEKGEAGEGKEKGQGEGKAAGRQAEPSDNQGQDPRPGGQCAPISSQQFSGYGLCRREGKGVNKGWSALLPLEASAHTGILWRRHQLFICTPNTVLLCI